MTGISPTRRVRRLPFVALLAGLSIGLTASPGARAEEPMTIMVTLKDHRFTPSEIHVPVGKRVILHIQNNDTTADGFDSSALEVEKVIAGGNYGIVRLRPLGPGRYPFMGEFHSDTAQGVVIAQ